MAEHAMWKQCIRELWQWQCVVNYCLLFVDTAGDGIDLTVQLLYEAACGNIEVWIMQYVDSRNLLHVTCMCSVDTSCMLFLFTRARLPQATTGHTSTARCAMSGWNSTTLLLRRHRGKMLRRTVLEDTTTRAPTVSCTSTLIIRTFDRSPASVVSSCLNLTSPRGLRGPFKWDNNGNMRLCSIFRVR